MNILSTIAGLVGGAVNPILGLLVSTMQSGFKAAIQFHKEGIAFARDVGLSAKEAQAYTDVLIKRTQVLANQYGVSAEAILQIQRNISEATGKQLMLNDAQNEGFVQINKLVGSQTATKFAEEIMNGMGGQIGTVQGAISKAYATATKQGLNAKKLTDKVAQNLSMANRLTFKNGVDGITKMAALSEKLGFKMQSIESAASKFLDLDKAIEGAARMQMLGGSAAVSFGNPLTAMYEANYDPEAFAKRMTDSLASYATFDKNKGIANVNGMNMDFVRQIGEQLGIGTEEATRIAKKQAEVKYKEGAFGGTLGQYNEQERNFILNKSYVENGRLKINDVSGKAHDISSGKLDKKILDELTKFNGKSDRDIMETQARTLTSIDERISGAASTVAASFAKGIDEYLPSIGQKIQTLGDILSNYAEQWGKDTGEAIGKAMHWINAHSDMLKSTIEGILGGITNIFNFFSTHWKELINAIIAWKAMGMALNGKGPRGGTPTGGGALAGAASAKGSNGNNGGASPRGGGPHGGSTITAGTENGRSYEAFNDNGKQYRRYSDGTIEELKGKKGNKQWKKVSPNRQATIEQTYQQKAASNNPTSNGGNSANGANAARAAKAAKRLRALKAGGSSALLGGVFSGVETYLAMGDYDKAEEQIMRSDELTDSEKKESLKIIKEERNRSIAATWGGTVLGGTAVAALNYFTGGLGFWGSTAAYMGGDTAGRLIGNWAGGLMSSDVDDKDYEELVKKYNKEKHANGGIIDKEKSAASGIIGGNSTSGDNIIAPFKREDGSLGLAGVNSKEMVLNGADQANLFKFIKSLPNIIPNVISNVQTVNSNAYSNVTSYRAVNNPIDNITNVSTAVNNLSNIISKLFTSDVVTTNKNLTNVSNLNSNAYSNVTSYRAVNNPLSNIINNITNGGLISTISNINSNTSSSLVNMMSRLLTNNNDNSNTSNVTSYRANYNSDTFAQRIYNSLLANNNSISKPNNVSNMMTSMVSNALANSKTDISSPNNVSNMMTSMVSSILTNQNDVRTKPVGDKEYIYVPKNSETSNVNGNKISVNDFNINLSGTIKLDGGNNSKNVDVNALLNDFSFMNALKEMIKTSINNDMHFGRYMTDLATLRNHVSPLSII